MNIAKEEIRQVLGALHADPHTADWDAAITLLQSKLAEPAHTDHPMRHHDRTCPACHEDAEPIAKPWVGLTKDEWPALYVQHHDTNGHTDTQWGYEEAIEAKLKEKNT
jgi:hypothetical protein